VQQALNRFRIKDEVFNLETVMVHHDDGGMGKQTRK
jgi:hypothetical protein